MKKIAFITLGCKLNYAETSTYERELLKEGFEAVPWNKGADVFLVNTCTVTEHSDKKSRNIIRKLTGRILRRLYMLPDVRHSCDAVTMNP